VLQGAPSHLPPKVLLHRHASVGTGRGDAGAEEKNKKGQDTGLNIFAAAGLWYQRVLGEGKWIAVGIVIGFVGGMAK
jgi:hypothetical protein